MALRAAALEAVGNLAFAAEARKHLLARSQLLQAVHHISAAADPIRLKTAAVRVLAILGENDKVREAVGLKPIDGRGLRVLSMDGGGMKGIATLRVLRQLEMLTGKRICELFDVIVGTSTGGLLSVAIGLRHMTLDECEAIYKNLGQKVC